MNTTKRHWIISLFGIGLTLMLAGIMPLFMPVTVAYAQEAPPPNDDVGLYDLTSTPIVPTGENSYCAVCHSTPSRVAISADGYIRNLYVPPSSVANSVHGDGNANGTLGCVDCHGADSFPHDTPFLNRRDYTLKTNQLCVGCHVDQARDLQNGLHEQAIMAGNKEAAVCTDCHGAHDVQHVTRHPQLLAAVCGDCHATTIQEWRTSPHINVDVLGCGTCHSPHAQTLRIASREANDLCMNCHGAMPTIWVHSQHEDTILMTTGCVDCHMYAPDHANGGRIGTGHSMAIETIACTSCHADIAQRISTGELVVPESRPVITTAPTEESQEASVPADTIALIQGLILGIGFGITGAAVFITRGNKPTHPKEKEDVKDEAHD